MSVATNGAETESIWEVRKAGLETACKPCHEGLAQASEQRRESYFTQSD